MCDDVELLRRVAAGEVFTRPDDSDSSINAFNRLADRLFDLENEGYITIPSGRVQRDFQRAHGGYLALAPNITPLGEAQIADT